MRKVIVQEYDPDWPRQAKVEIDRIIAACGKDIISVEHIGSTSVPNLPAKPIIDLLGEVRDILIIDDYTPALEAIG